MSRRVSLPPADDLFRPTSDAPTEEPEGTRGAGRRSTGNGAVTVSRPGARRAVSDEPRRSSGRVRHEEKMTVYVTADELIDLEHARLTLRRNVGLAVDRGRLVREAVAIALADIELRGAESDIVRRLTEA